MIYRVAVGADGDLSLEMTYAHSPNNDLDLFLLASCDPLDCLASSAGTSGTESIVMTGLSPASITSRSTAMTASRTDRPTR